jgi:putative SOS response-associated peptidase YedK
MATSISAVGGLAHEQELLALLKPCPDEALKIWPIDKMVGNVRNNGPPLILPVLNNVPA